MLRISKKKASIAILLAMTLIPLLVINAVAVDNFGQVNQALDQQQQPAGTGGSIWVDIIKLILILAVIMGAAWTVVRFFGQRSTARMQGKWLKVVDEIFLDHNRSIVLCKAGNVVYGLGVTDHNISLLFKVDDKDISRQIDKFLVEQGTIPIETYSWKTVVNSIFKPRQTYSQNRKEFHWLIEEQARRLDNLAQSSPNDTDRGGRSGDYE
ncbi:MAG: FliO/MopB family protein [Deltaproteobacteria bacterium]